MIELFFNKELADISFEVEALDDWKKTCEELGLESQLTLTKGKETPIPYPFMNTTMVRVYETLCPRKVHYKEYKSSTIPLEVLKQIAFSVKDKHFPKIEIWYDDKSPDPVVVGYQGYYYVYDKSYSHVRGDDGKDMRFFSEKEAEDYKKDHDLYGYSFSEEAKFLIARWGDELRSFAELKKLAIERFVENEGGEMARQIKIMSEKLKCMKENATSYMNGNISMSQATGSSSF
jgi:hypothetical protein